MQSKSVVAACAGALALSAQLFATEVRAQEGAWPQRPVRLILPFGPASGADIGARLVAEKLQPVWGKPIVVEGKPGGDGLLSIGTVVNAKDDHVFFFGPTSAFIVHPYVHANLPYDPELDLQPVAGIAKVMISIAVPTSLGVNTLKEFVDYARANAGKTSYGVAPGFSEFVFNGFLSENNLQLAKVPYRDITTSPTDIGEGRIQLGMLSYAAMRAAAEGGRIKVIAINDAKRTPIAPSIPSVVEAGFPNLVASPVLSMIASRGVPLELRRKISADVVAAVKDKTVGERLLASGQPAEPMGVEDMTAYIKAQRDQVSRIATMVGIQKKK